jgi:hypothetical protein
MVTTSSEITTGNGGIAKVWVMKNKKDGIVTICDIGKENQKLRILG